MALAYAGDERARPFLEERRHQLPRQHPFNNYGSMTALMRVVEGLAVLGEKEEAAALYPLTELLVDTGTFVDHFALAMPDLAAGIAAACGEQWGAAEAHYRDALRQTIEVPYRLGEAETRRWLARMLLDRSADSDRETAAECLADARDIYASMGMPKHIEIVDVMRAE